MQIKKNFISNIFTNFFFFFMFSRPEFSSDTKTDGGWAFFGEGRVMVVISSSFESRSFLRPFFRRLSVRLSTTRSVSFVVLLG